MAKKPGDDNLYSFADLARDMAASGWGRRAPTQEEAIKGLSELGGAQAALLFLVRRFQQAVDAWRDDDNPQRKGDRGSRPKWAVAYPHAQLGQVLYGCGADSEYGPYAAVVAHKDAEGYIRVVNVLKPDEYASAAADGQERMLYLQWVSGNEPLFPTWPEAVRWRAARMRDEARRAVQMANDMEAAVDAGNTMEQLDDFISENNSWSYPLPGEPPSADDED